MLGIDTNVLLRFLVRDDRVQFDQAASAMNGLSKDNPGFISQVTLAELYWVLERAYRYRREDCLAVVRALIDTESLEFDDGEGVVRALTLAEAGADFPDALIHAGMELFGVTEIVTFDRSAAQHLGWRLLSADG